MRVATGPETVPWTSFVHAARFPQLDPKFVQLHQRRKRTLEQLGEFELLETTTHWRAAVGLGNACTFENSGVALHATYGFPVLPASSLKGIARYFLFEDPELSMLTAADCDISQEEFEALPRDNQLADLLFEKRNNAADDHLAAIRLLDGWPAQKPTNGWFAVDVLTVHHRDYYGGKKELAVDTEGPNPVHFLTFSAGVTFRIPLGLTAYGQSLADPQPAPAVCLKVARAILSAALRHIGVGAKTASGYGRML
jgi:CRISPR-associated protein Cmr6